LIALGTRPGTAASLLVALLLALVLAAPADAGTITVTTTFDQRDAVAPCSLREAVDTANQDVNSGGCVDPKPGAADTIKLAGGDYDLRLSGVEDANAGGDLDVVGNVTIAGAGADATAIDGNGATAGDRVLQVNSGTVTVSGLTVHGGQAPGGAGGIAAAAGTTLRVVDSTVSDNVAAAAGGISTAGTLTLSGSTVTGNRANFAGGIFANTAVLTNSTVSGNTATNGAAGGISATRVTLTSSTVSGNTAANGPGGGIEATTATLTGSTVSGNTSDGFSGGGLGGGIRVTGTATLTRSTVSGNTAGGGFGLGGGIFGAGTLTDSSVRRNDASKGGAIYAVGPLTLNRSTIAGNDSTDNGGGILFDNPGTLTVINSTLSGNESENFGGAIAAEDGAVSLRSSTITRNLSNGGGLARRETATVTIRNTILAGNADATTDPEYHDWFCEGGGGVVSQGYNLLPTTAGCTVAPAAGDQAVADPGLALLADNGGPTLTHAVLATSPAVNAGSPAAPGSGGVSCPATDQRGVPRTLGGRCDTGAYERATCQGRLVNLVGTAGADTLIGTSATDGILGLGGNDVLAGGGAGDGLCGGDGADSMDGGAGTDTCDGGAGTDQAVRCETLVSVP
jgi:CSLREA domain-containing protein